MARSEAHFYRRQADKILQLADSVEDPSQKPKLFIMAGEWTRRAESTPDDGAWSEIVVADSASGD